MKKKMPKNRRKKLKLKWEETNIFLPNSKINKKSRKIQKCKQMA